MAIVELVRGQNTPLSAAEVQVTVRCAVAVEVSALLVDIDRKVRSSDDLVYYNQRTGPGVRLMDGGVISIDTAALPSSVDAVLSIVSVDPGAAAVGSAGAPLVQLKDAAGVGLVQFEVSGLSSERAVIGFEIYRRGAGWKVRAVGQGYDEGLAQALLDHGVEVDAAAGADAAGFQTVGIQPVGFQPVGGTAAGAQGDDPAAQYRQLWAIFEDAARSASALSSASEFARERLDEELSSLIADPRTRNSPTVGTQRAQAQRRHDDLVDVAYTDHTRDVAQLRAELEQLEERFPAAMAKWAAPSWLGDPARMAPSPAIRVGELHRPDSGELRIPLCIPVPLGRSLLVDTTADALAPDLVDDSRILAVVSALILRILAAYPPGAISLEIIDAAQRLTALTATARGLLAGPAVTNSTAIAPRLRELTDRIDLAAMSRESGVPLDIDGDPNGRSTHRLVVLTEYPYGYDESAIARIQLLAARGPACGLFLLLVARGAEIDRGDPSVGSVTTSLQRVPVGAFGALEDRWTGLPWSFTPDLCGADATWTDRLVRGWVQSALDASRDANSWSVDG